MTRYVALQSDLEDLSRAVAKLDSDTLKTSEFQEEALSRLESRLNGTANAFGGRLDDIERRCDESAAGDTEQARRICNLEDSNLDIISDLGGFDTLAMEFSDMKGIVANLFNLVNGLVGRMEESERRAIESDQFARQVHTTASGNSVAVDTLARKLEESVDPLWEPVDWRDGYQSNTLKVGCTCGPCEVHARLVDKLEHMSAAEYKQPEEWMAYAGWTGDPCWNDPSKRCNRELNTCATCVPVEDTVESAEKTYEERLWPYAPIKPTPGEEWWYKLIEAGLPGHGWRYNPNWDDHLPVEYTLGTSGEKLTGPFEPTPGEEWWYNLRLLMWEYNPNWYAAPTRNTTTPLHVLRGETPPCDSCPCAVCDDARHTLRTYFHKATPSAWSLMYPNAGPSDPTPGEEWWYNYLWARWDYNPAWNGHSPECSPALACRECHPFAEKDRILCGGMSLTARPDCPCSRCVLDQGIISRFRKTWLA